MFQHLKNRTHAVWLFVRIVWRPAYPPLEASWWEAHWKYALSARTAWEVAAGIWLDRF